MTERRFVLLLAALYQIICFVRITKGEDGEGGHLCSAADWSLGCKQQPITFTADFYAMRSSVWKFASLTCLSPVSFVIYCSLRLKLIRYSKSPNQAEWYVPLLLVKITITEAIHINSDMTVKCLTASHCSAADRIHPAVVR